LLPLILGSASAAGERRSIRPSARTSPITRMGTWCGGCLAGV
jgi:hypothetical protein